MNISGTHVEFGLCEYSNEFSESHVEKWLLDLCWVSNIIHFLLTLQRNMVPWAQWKTMSTVLISKENDSLTAILIGKYKKKKKKSPFCESKSFPSYFDHPSSSKKEWYPSFPADSSFQESCTERFVPLTAWSWGIMMANYPSGVGLQRVPYHTQELWLISSMLWIRINLFHPFLVTVKTQTIGIQLAPLSSF